MKEIKLTQNKVALVDDSDYEWLMQWKWFAHKQRNTYYAGRRDRLSNGKYISIWMHREIILPPNGLEIDHKDRDGLNCQRNNLRICTHAQNGMNRIASGKSKFIGVSYNGDFIRSVIKINGKSVHIGYFKTEEDAAKAYDKKAIEIHGEFANLNFK